MKRDLEKLRKNKKDKKSERKNLYFHLEPPFVPRETDFHQSKYLFLFS